MKMHFAFCAGLFLATAAVSAEIPLPEHPRPDWNRTEWLNLNGPWKFAFDRADAGLRERLFAAEDAKFPLTITVPFGWGSPASGVKNEADVAWYRRNVTIPSAWKGKRVFLVVGASDHDTTCWFAGVKVASHAGGYTPFEAELTDFIQWDKPQPVTMRVWDMPAKDAPHSAYLYGKQGYGNVRGIWQTVYLEARGEQYVKSVRFLPDVPNGAVTAEVALDTPAKRPLEFSVNFKQDDRAQPATVAFAPGQLTAVQRIKLRGVKLWDLENPYLYEVTCRLEAPATDKTPAAALDAVNTYFGMREISVMKLPGKETPYLALNGKPVYLQLTLDQSYHPDGYYTFPSDEFMRNEILISKRLGLSGNRIHIKVEVPRKLYWADRLGLLVMADVPCAWGPACEAMFRNHRNCLEGMVARDFNHPSIFSWVLFNETWGLFADGENWGKNRTNRYAPWIRAAVAEVWQHAKALDPTRLVEDNSACNNDHVITDLNTWHAYLPGYGWEDTVKRRCDKAFPGSTDNYIGGHVQTGAPMLNSECGNVWGYRGSTGDCDFTWDYHQMINAFRRHLACGGWLYTEHHDVINEWNGYVRYDRTWKETGIEELFPGCSLRDFHADAFLPFNAPPCRAFPAGATWSVPVDVSLVTDRYAGRTLALSHALRYRDGTGKTVDVPASAEACDFSFAASAWQNGPLAEVPVKLPDGAACGTVNFTLKDGTNVVARNFICFVTEAQAAANVLAVAPTGFVASAWSERQWSAMNGAKVCGAGKGSFTYAFTVPVGTQAAVFRAEVGTKRLYAKDMKDLGKKGVNDGNCMLGGGFADRSRNRNAYPQTSVDKWPGLVKVYANERLVATVTLPDDPADHRGILSWFRQAHDGYLDEAGSYGWPVEANIPADIVSKGGVVKIRLESDGHGLAIYGASSGRLPYSPHLALNP